MLRLREWVGGGGQGGSRTDCVNIGRVAGRAAALDEDFAEGSERFERCREIECEYDAGRFDEYVEGGRA